MSGTLPVTSTIISESDSAEFDLVEMLLAEQRSLTAVERFSALHEAGSVEGQAQNPKQARYYRELLPATPPGPGQQFGFSVDLDACSGCKACVVACHTMNGLEEDESWRRVGTITIGEGSESRIGHVTTACHHCDDPGCLNGCPVKAYDKDPVTGIVRHLDDQCIGCKYCTMMCPYEVPRYSERLGVVRKCDMCHQRLSVGEAPACVQACPNEAISIRLVESAALATADRLAPGAPCSTISRPSTEYTSRHAALVAESIPQDIGVDDVAESHWPLAAMLVGTQVSVGMLLAERLAATAMWLAGSTMPIEVTQINTLLAFVIGMIGLNIAPLHLGQPLRAWRVFLGLRTSWLSREAVVLGKYAAMLTLSLALLWLPTYVAYVPDWISTRIPNWAATAALGTAALLGAAGLLSSAMIYIVTKRRLWTHNRTLPRFLGSAAVSGTACCGLAMMIGQAPVAITAVVLLVSIVLLLWKLAWEWRIHLGPTRDEDDVYDRRSRRLANEHLAGLQTDRLFSGIAAAGLLCCGLLALILKLPIAAMVIVGFGAVMQVAGESCERLLYFKSVVYDRMPGTLR